jgi:Tol biopolymer transport system component
MFDLASGRERVLALPDKDRGYTQPAYGEDGDPLFVVVLKEGASADTDILSLGVDRGNREPVVARRSAQSDPAPGTDGWLYYSNVHCTTDCGHIIQEIWRKDLVSGEAEQLTLLNALSRQPVLSGDGKTLYFSSNRGGNFHIWSLDRAAGRYRQLSDGLVTDTDPAIDADGTLYFIRRSPSGTRLMSRDGTGRIVEVTLPEGITDLRDLEIDP